MAVFQETINNATQEELSKRRARRKEVCMQENTWKLIDRGRKIKGMQQQVQTNEPKLALREEYKPADRDVKRSCRKTKKLVSTKSS